MSLLPQQIPPPNVPIGRVTADGRVLPETNFWLLLYNLWLNSIGAGIPASDLLEVVSTDNDVTDTDTVVLRQQIANLSQTTETLASSNDLPDIARALLLAQEPLLPDPFPRAQPFAAVAPTGSPFTYTAAFPGLLVSTGGTVSTVVLIRQGTSITVPNGIIPMSRLDQVQIIYSVAPTLTFIPGSPA